MPSNPQAMSSTDQPSSHHRMVLLAERMLLVRPVQMVVLLNFPLLLSLCLLIPSSVASTDEVLEYRPAVTQCFRRTN